MQTKLARGGGDDLLARERAAAALDQVPVAGRLIGAVDVDLEVAGGVEVEHVDARGLQPGGRGFRAGDGAADAAATRGEGIDEEVDGGTGADADDAVVADPFEGGLRGGLLAVLAALLHGGPLGGEIVRRRMRSRWIFRLRKGRSPLSRASSEGRRGGR